MTLILVFDGLVTSICVDGLRHKLGEGRQDLSWY